MQEGHGGWNPRMGEVQISWRNIFEAFFVEPRMDVTASSVTIIIVNICCDVSVCG